MRQVGEARLRTLEELLAEAERPVALVGDPLPEEAQAIDDPGVTVLGGPVARGDCQAVWRLGRERAKRGQFDDPAMLVPAYIREPEAVTLWNKREASR